MGTRFGTRFANSTGDVEAAAPRVRSWQTGGELAGECVVDEVFEDGRIVLRPDTSVAAIRERAGVEPVTNDEFGRAFGHLPSDSEG